MNRTNWNVRQEGDVFWILQEPAVFQNHRVDPDELSSHLGTDKKNIVETALTSTGNPVLLCEISDQKSLDGLKPNWNDLADFSRKHEVMGLHCYTFEPHHAENHLTARVFAPAYGINEDPATGSTTGSLTLHILSRGKVNPKDGILRIEQGVAMGRPSLLFGRRATSSDATFIEVGGKAKTVFSGIIEL